MATRKAGKYLLNRYSESRRVVVAAEKDATAVLNEDPKVLVAYVAAAVTECRSIPCPRVVQLSKMVGIPLVYGGVVLNKLSETGFVKPIRFDNIYTILNEAKKLTE